MSVAATARSPWPDMNIVNTNRFKGTLKNHFTFPSGSRDFKSYLMSPTISLSLVAAALHNQVFVMFCYIDIRNGGLIKAVVLIQRNPNLSCGACPLLSTPLHRCLPHAADIISNHLCRNWNCEFGMSWLLTVMSRFSPTTLLSVLLRAAWHRQHFLPKSPLHMYDSINMLQ